MRKGWHGRAQRLDSAAWSPFAPAFAAVTPSRLQARVRPAAPFLPARPNGLGFDPCEPGEDVEQHREVLLLQAERPRRSEVLVRDGRRRQRDVELAARLEGVDACPSASC